MKGSIVLVVGIIFFFFLTSCKKQQEKNVQPQPTPKKMVESTTISQDTFKVWKARWDNKYRAYFASDSLHYFDLPVVDLATILGEDSIEDARLYMGMDHNLIPHTMVVGVTSEGPNFETIVDYSTSCPPICGNN